MALRKTELFLAYDRKPYDVGEWYRTVRRNPSAASGFDSFGINGSGFSSFGGRLSPISPASSTVTLSPDGSRTWLDEDRVQHHLRDTSLTRQRRRGSPAPFLRDPTPPRKESHVALNSVISRPPPAISAVAAAAARHSNGGSEGNGNSNSRTLPPPGAPPPRSVSPSLAVDRPTTLDISTSGKLCFISLLLQFQ